METPDGFCEQHSHERLYIAKAEACAREILERYIGVSVAKEMRLESDTDFDLAVVRLADQLRDRSYESERAAVATVVQELDVDWAATTPAKRRELVGSAMAGAQHHLVQIATAAHLAFGPAGAQIAQAIRRALRYQAGLTLGRGFTALDKRTMKFNALGHCMLVRDAGARRLAKTGNDVNDVIAQGMASGLGRDDLAAMLRQAVEHTLAIADTFYWERVAAAFVAQARSYAQVAAYAEAGVQKYQIHAVVDEKTSNTCRFMHGRIFSVSCAMQQINAAESATTAQEFLDINPWIRESRGEIFFMRAGRKHVIARVQRFEIRGEDDIENYDSGPSGLALPPYHALCRSNLVPLTT